MGNNYLSFCYVLFLFHEKEKSIIFYRKEKPYREKNTDILKQINYEMYKTNTFDKTDRIRIFVFCEQLVNIGCKAAPKGLFEKASCIGRSPIYNRAHKQ